MLRSQVHWLLEQKVCAQPKTRQRAYLPKRTVDRTNVAIF